MLCGQCYQGLKLVMFETNLATGEDTLMGAREASSNIFDQFFGSHELIVVSPSVVAL